MKQLSGTDAYFLAGEHGNVYNHIALLTIYDISTAPRGSVRFKDILKHFENRLYTHPVFRSRLVTPPLGIDRPYWVADKSVEIEFHVRHIALPKPGDWRQLMIQVARLHSRPLDRNRPLWEAYIIEGLDNIPKLPAGSFAMLLKLHHSAVDDLAGVLLTEQIHATTPRVDSVNSGHATVKLEKTPLHVELLSKAFAHTVERASQVALFTYRAASLAIAIGKERLEKLSGSRDTTFALPSPPHTRFNHDVSANRVSEGMGMPLSCINRIREKIPGVTIDDVVAATVGGALRRYLSNRKELGQKSLVASMPTRLRGAADDEPGPSLLLVRSDIADPVERLQAVGQDARKAPLDTESMGSALAVQLLDVAPAFVGNVLAKRIVTRRYNLGLATVTGPETPIYLAGAKAMCLYSFGMPVDGAGLSISGVSYNRVMWLSIVACREMLPDPGVFVQCLRDSWQELLAAADAMNVPVINRKQAKPMRVRKLAKKPSRPSSPTSIARV